jgi:hypothetical protein
MLAGQFIVEYLGLGSSAVHGVKLKVAEKASFLHELELLEQLFSTFRENIIFDWLWKQMERLVEATSVDYGLAFSLL